MRGSCWHGDMRQKCYHHWFNFSFVLHDDYLLSDDLFMIDIKRKSEQMIWTLRKSDTVNKITPAAKIDYKIQFMHAYVKRIGGVMGCGRS